MINASLNIQKCLQTRSYLIRGICQRETKSSSSCHPACCCCLDKDQSKFGKSRLKLLFFWLLLLENHIGLFLFWTVANLFSHLVIQVTIILIYVMYPVLLYLKIWNDIYIETIKFLKSFLNCVSDVRENFIREERKVILKEV